MEIAVTYLHYLGMSMLMGILSAELFLLKRDLTQKEAQRIQLIDLGYLFVALLMVGTGLSRVFWFAKGSEYYFSNSLFYLKVSTFTLVGLISIFPTIKYLRWNRAFKKSKVIHLSENEYSGIRRWILIQLLLFPLIPLFAVLMARGIGS